MSETTISVPKTINGYIKVENDGEIDINAILLLGASSKRGDSSKIGFFGSGLKYALAVLLKNNIPFHIYSGEKEIKVSTTKEKFRGVDVEIIKVNNRKTSLTTDMGPDWKPWFAIREIYCNAIDEGNHDIGISKEPTPVKGKTTFFVKFDYQLSELFSNWNLYFSEKREDIVHSSAEQGTTVFSGNKDRFIIYRKGVQAHIDSQKSLYHYDLTWATINESRILSSYWQINYSLPKIWGKIATKEMIIELFNNFSNTVEEKLDWDGVSYFNKNWLEVINNRTLIVDSVAGFFMEEIASNRDGHLILPAKIVQSLKSYFGHRIKVRGMTDEAEDDIEIPITKEQVKDCNFAVKFLKKGGINVEASIKIFQFKQESKLGEARNGEIRLSPKIFGMGRRKVIAVILEEASHLESGAGDKSRSFQDYLLNMVINSIQDKLEIRL